MSFWIDEQLLIMSICLLCLFLIINVYLSSMYIEHISISISVLPPTLVASIRKAKSVSLIVPPGAHKHVPPVTVPQGVSPVCTRVLHGRVLSYLNGRRLEPSSLL